MLKHIYLEHKQTNLWNMFYSRIDAETCENHAFLDNIYQIEPIGLKVNVFVLYYINVVSALLPCSH